MSAWCRGRDRTRIPGFRPEVSHLTYATGSTTIPTFRPLAYASAHDPPGSLRLAVYHRVQPASYPRHPCYRKRGLPGVEPAARPGLASFPTVLPGLSQRHATNGVLPPREVGALSLRLSGRHGSGFRPRRVTDRRIRTFPRERASGPPPDLFLPVDGPGSHRLGSVANTRSL